MKSKAVLTLAASAVVTLLAACGGGGGGGDNTPTTTPTPGATSSSLQVSGTAATGAALAGASVEVKCAAGTATATTAADGTYSVTITDGALPCMVEVKKTVNGATVSLHALASSGTTADGRTTAHANVTPVTEMIVAHASAALPEDSFKGFKAGSLTPQQAQAAAAAIVAALRDAGVDLGSIDPVTGNLVAASSSGPGNGYDQLLDALAAKVDRDALKVLVNQIAIAAQANSDDGLKNAMHAVSGGSLAGCPVAVSGAYRSLDLFGTMQTHTIDFRTMRLATVGTTDTMTLTADASNACVFTAAGKYLGLNATLKVVIGSSGAGTFRAVTDQAFFDTPGYLFPVQSHSYSELRGTWSTLDTRMNPKTHTAGQVTFGEERKVTACEYDVNWTCVPAASTLAASQRSDGGVAVALSASEAVTVYGYRAPNGAFALYGAHQATSNLAIEPVSVVATQLAPLPLPSVGSTVTSWDGGISISPELFLVTTPPAPITYTITATDPAAGTATRRNDVTGRVETLRYNTPLPGVRTRDAGTFNGSRFAQLVQIPLTGLGMTISVNAQPFGPGNNFIHNIAVVKP